MTGISTIVNAEKNSKKMFYHIVLTVLTLVSFFYLSDIKICKAFSKNEILGYCQKNIIDKKDKIITAGDTDEKDLTVESVNEDYINVYSLKRPSDIDLKVNYNNLKTGDVPEKAYIIGSSKSGNDMCISLYTDKEMTTDCIYYDFPEKIHFKGSNEIEDYISREIGEYKTYKFIEFDNISNINIILVDTENGEYVIPLYNDSYIMIPDTSPLKVYTVSNFISSYNGFADTVNTSAELTGIDSGVSDSSVYSKIAAVRIVCIGLFIVSLVVFILSIVLKKQNKKMKIIKIIISVFAGVIFMAAFIITMAFQKGDMNTLIIAQRLNNKNKVTVITTGQEKEITLSRNEIVKYFNTLKYTKDADYKPTEEIGTASAYIIKGNDGNIIMYYPGKYVKVNDTFYIPNENKDLLKNPSQTIFDKENPYVINY